MTRWQLQSTPRKAWEGSVLKALLQRQRGVARGAVLLVSAVGKERPRLVPGCLATAHRGAWLEQALGFKHIHDVQDRLEPAPMRAAGSMPCARPGA